MLTFPAVGLGEIGIGIVEGTLKVFFAGSTEAENRISNHLTRTSQQASVSHIIDTMVVTASE